MKILLITALIQCFSLIASADENQSVSCYKDNSFYSKSSSFESIDLGMGSFNDDLGCFILSRLEQSSVEMQSITRKWLKNDSYTIQFYTVLRGKGMTAKCDAQNFEYDYSMIAHHGSRYEGEGRATGLSFDQCVWWDSSGNRVKNQYDFLSGKSMAPMRDANADE